MKTIWLPVGKLELHSFKRAHKDFKDKSAYASLQIGNALNVDGILYSLERWGITSNWSGASARPSVEPVILRRRTLLRDALFKSLSELRQQNNKLLRDYLEGNTEELVLPAWPIREDSKKLRIPITFIRLYGFEYRPDNMVTCHVNLGWKIAFWGILVYKENKICTELKHFNYPNIRESIKDERIKKEIFSLLRRKNVRDYLQYVVSQKPIIDPKVNFTTGKFSEIPPPIRFY